MRMLSLVSARLQSQAQQANHRFAAGIAHESYVGILFFKFSSVEKGLVGTPATLDAPMSLRLEQRSIRYEEQVREDSPCRDYRVTAPLSTPGSSAGHGYSWLQ